MIQMTDGKRLELLKEIAGTKTYDERRRESMKIMNETDSRREQIEEVIGHIESRLEDLEGEKEELNQFQELDSQRRSLEYAIYDKELKVATDKVEALDRSKEDSSQESQLLHKKAAELKEERIQLEEESKHLTDQTKELKVKLGFLKKDQEEYGKKAAVLELKLKEHQDKIDSNKSRRKQATQELQTLTKSISTAKKNLASITKAYDKYATQEEKLKHELQMQEQRLHSLHAKKGRTQQFASKAERDRHLKKKVKNCQADMKKTDSTMSQVSKEISGLEKNIAKIKKSLKQKNKESTLAV